VTKVERSGTSASSRYRRAGGSVPVESDVDHTHDLQLGGQDELFNMAPLNSSVNRSLGAQIQSQIKNLPPGTTVDSITIGH
jgi:filamentous hemagglutinin